MANIIDNPYNQTLEEVNRSVVLRRNEYDELRTEVFSSFLDEKVNALIKDKTIKQLKSKTNLSEEETNAIVLHDFDVEYYQEKLATFKEYEKNYKKYQQISEHYIDLINKRIDKFMMNCQIRNQFTEEEIRKNPEIKKLVNDKPNGFDDGETKYLKAHFLLSNLAKKFNEMSQEDHDKKFEEFVNENKVSDKKSQNIKINEKIEKSLQKPNEILNFNKNEFENIKEKIAQTDNVSDELLEDLRSILMRVMKGNEIEYFSRFENELINDFALMDSPYKLNGSPFLTSIKEYTSGLEEMNNIFTYNSDYSVRNKEIEKYFNTHLFKANEEDIKSTPSRMNRLIGATNCLTSKHESNYSSSKLKKIFNKKYIEQYEQEGSILKRVQETLINYIGVDPNLVIKGMSASLLTEDKKQELGNALVNSFLQIKDKSSLVQIDNIGINKKIANYMTKMIEAKVSNVDVFSVFDEYHNEKVKRLLSLETSLDNDEAKIERALEEARRSRKVGYSTTAARNAIKGD